MNFQDASNLRIPEGYVRTIHDKNNRLLWGSVGYDVSFDGNATQTTYSGKNLFSGDYAQFDNQGGTGSIYDYFKLPTSDAYYFSLKAKNAITPSNHYIGFNYGGGTAQVRYKWIYQNTSATAGQVFKGENFDTNDRLQYMFMYPKGQETLDWFKQNFELIQLEKGTQATAYEPYVGGTPAPNPDYPQPISTVTGAQTVTVTGKNLVEDALAGMSINSSGTIGAGDEFQMNLAPVMEGRTYTMSIDGSQYVYGFFASKPVFNSVSYDSARTVVQSNPTFTAPITGYVAFRSSNGYANAQLELGSTATAYEPYQGQEFEVNLGSTELAKIPGTDYRDKILYDKTTGKWYIEKQVGKEIIDGTSILRNDSYAQLEYATIPKPTDSFAYGNYDSPIGKSIATCATAVDVPGGWNHSTYVGKFSTQAANARTWIGFTKGTSLEDMQSALNGQIIYYALATPTTTEITNQTLIDQLEAVYDWVRRHGYNTQVSGNLPIIINRTALPTA